MLICNFFDSRNDCLNLYEIEYLDIHTRLGITKRSTRKCFRSRKIKCPSNRGEGQRPHMTQQKRSRGCLNFMVSTERTPKLQSDEEHCSRSQNSRFAPVDDPPTTNFHPFTHCGRVQQFKLLLFGDGEYAREPPREHGRVAGALAEHG